MSTCDNEDLSDHRWIAHALVRREDTVLILRRGAGRYLGGQWDIPGGTVEQGESAAEAAGRETQEEAGLLIEIGDEIAHYANRDTKGRPICFHTVTFAGHEVNRQQVTLSPLEHDDHRWVGLEEARGFDLVWHVRRTIADLVDGPAR